MDETPNEDVTETINQKSVGSGHGSDRKMQASLEYLIENYHAVAEMDSIRGCKSSRSANRRWSVSWLPDTLRQAYCRVCQ